MRRGQGLAFCLIILAEVLNGNADSNYAGAAVSSDSSGTRSVLISGKNGAAGVGVLSSRFGGSGGGITTRVGPSYGPGGASASAGPGGAFAGAGGVYAGAGGAGTFGFPYWNGGGSYGSSAGFPDYYDGPYYQSGGGVGVYSDSNGISTRLGSVGPGGQATIVTQNGNEPPRVYNYRGVDSSNEDFDN